MMKIRHCYAWHWAGTLLVRLPGRRTLRELAIAAVPSRMSLIFVGLAFCAVVATKGVALIATKVGLAAVAAKAMQYGATFEAMPLWVLIGTSMSQVATRLVQALDDTKSWWETQSWD